MPSCIFFFLSVTWGTKRAGGWWKPCLDAGFSCLACDYCWSEGAQRAQQQVVRTIQAWIRCKSPHVVISAAQSLACLWSTQPAGLQGAGGSKPCLGLCSARSPSLCQRASLYIGMGVHGFGHEFPVGHQYWYQFSGWCASVSWRTGDKAANPAGEPDLWWPLLLHCASCLSVKKDASAGCDKKGNWKLGIWSDLESEVKELLNLP